MRTNPTQQTLDHFGQELYFGKLIYQSEWGGQMERKYTDCRNALTSDCPNQKNKLMLATLASESNKEITLDVFDRASSLCVKCEKFSPWTQ